MNMTKSSIDIFETDRPNYNTLKVRCEYRTITTTYQIILSVEQNKQNQMEN